MPRENEDVNHIWISDRDRFSYEGLSSSNRLEVPKQKIDGKWCDIDWDSAINSIVSSLRAPTIKDNLRAFISPSSTNEEFYLLQSLVRGVGSNFIDHRLRQVDFRNDQRSLFFPKIPDKQELDSNDLIILLGAFPEPISQLQILRYAIQLTGVLKLSL